MQASTMRNMINTVPFNNDKQHRLTSNAPDSAFP